MQITPEQADTVVQHLMAGNDVPYQDAVHAYIEANMVETDIKSAAYMMELLTHKSAFEAMLYDATSAEGKAYLGTLHAAAANGGV